MRICSAELEDEKCTEKSHSMITCAAEFEEERQMRILVVKDLILLALKDLILSALKSLILVRASFYEMFSHI